jgi:hypothetical protein
MIRGFCERGASHGAFLLALCLALGGCAEPGQQYSEDADEAQDLGRDQGSADAASDLMQDAGSDAAADTRPDFPERPPPDCDEGLTACGIHCVSVTTDADNCGTCGRTCVLPHAAAACVNGECAVGACEEGFGDRDGNLANGCEAEILCTAGGPCETACGSVGAVICQDDEQVCSIPPETCNAVDDNCDGGCDEGGLPGCRVGVHRSSGNGHLYTTDLAAAMASPYNLEAQNYFRVYAQPVPGTRPLFLCRKGNGKRFLTSDTACENAGGQERQLGYWSPTELCGAIPLYRLYQESSQNHFYTTNAGERDNAANNLGYVSEGIGGWVWPQP